MTQKVVLRRKDHTSIACVPTLSRLRKHAVKAKAVQLSLAFALLGFGVYFMGNGF